MIDLLKKITSQEIEILGEIDVFSKKAEKAGAPEKAMLSESMDALVERMKKDNASFLEILKKMELLPQKNEEGKKEGGKVVEVKKEEVKGGKIEKIMPKLKKREHYLKELEITENVLKKLKEKKKVEKVEQTGFKKARGYLKFANRYFRGSAEKLIKKGYFSNLPLELRKSNLNMLFEGYVAMMLMSVFLSFAFALFLTAILLVSGTIGALTGIFLPIVIPIIVFLALYFYPGTEGSSISSRINAELPFAVIHMNSISGSGIAPVEIFKIIAMSKEYPYLRKELRKVLNQINIYGYDLVSALNNVAKTTSNQHLAELFIGISTTINSGGSLSSFFEKRAETLLNDYRLEREKAIKVAETSMDIYISVVIAAPMMLMLMLVMISVSGIQIGFTPYQLTFLTIGGVALINIIFLGYLQTKRVLT